MVYGAMLRNLPAARRTNMVDLDRGEERWYLRTCIHPHLQVALPCHIGVTG